MSSEKEALAAASTSTTLRARMHRKRLTMSGAGANGGREEGDQWSKPNVEVLRPAFEKRYGVPGRGRRGRRDKRKTDATSRRLCVLLVLCGELRAKFSAVNELGSRQRFSKFGLAAPTMACVHICR